MIEVWMNSFREPETGVNEAGNVDMKEDKQESERTLSKSNSFLT